MTSFLRTWNPGIAGLTPKGREARRRKARANLGRPILEPLDARLLLAADIGSIIAPAGLAPGAVTIAGDDAADALILDQGSFGVVDANGDPVLDGSGHHATEVRLTHNLPSPGGVGDYADSSDFDPSPGVARIRAGAGRSGGHDHGGPRRRATTP
jgi:hypothetical protein